MRLRVRELPGADLEEKIIGMRLQLTGKAAIHRVRYTGSGAGGLLTNTIGHAGRTNDHAT
jgi:hypothetical protein